MRRGDRCPQQFCEKGRIGSIFLRHEPNEPPHVHVDRDDQSAKLWLEPVTLAYNLGFADKELGTIESIVREHQQQFLEA